MLFDTRFAPWEFISPGPGAERAAQRSNERPAALSFLVASPLWYLVGSIVYFNKGLVLALIIKGYKK